METAKTSNRGYILIIAVAIGVTMVLAVVGLWIWPGWLMHKPGPTPPPTPAPITPASHVFPAGKGCLVAKVGLNQCGEIVNGKMEVQQDKIPSNLYTWVSASDGADECKCLKTLPKDDVDLKFSNIIWMDDSGKAVWCRDNSGIVRGKWPKC